jgi:hypothetical protein
MMASSVFAVISEATNRPINRTTPAADRSRKPESARTAIPAAGSSNATASPVTKSSTPTPTVLLPMTRSA